MALKSDRAEAFSGDAAANFVLRGGMVLLVVLVIVLAYARGGAERHNAGRPREAREPGAVDVVLVVVDTERFDFTGPGGYHESTTPFLMTLASRGITFTSAYATGPWTVPSMYSLMTGLWPSQHGMVAGQSMGSAVSGQKVMPPEAETLAERLGTEGYETFAINTNFHLGSRFGMAQGFDHFLGEDFSFMPFPNMALEALAPRIRSSGKYFVWLHYLDPHHPYRQHEPWFSRYNESNLSTYQDLGLEATMTYYRQKQGIAPDLPLGPGDVTPYYALAEAFTYKPMLLFTKLGSMGIAPKVSWRGFLAASYASEIRATDGAMKAALEDVLKVDDGTLVIVTSDHGEELWDRGSWGHRGSDSLHQELVHVPLVVVLPGGAHAGTVIDAPVSLVDLMPTILDLAGARVPRDLPGISLLDVVQEGTTADRPLFAEVDSILGVARCIVEYPYKYIHNFTMDEGELYDLSTDPGEEHDLSDQQPERALAMKEALVRWHDTTPPWFSPLDPGPLNAAELLKLRMLGYVE